jgi:hypothetical protein
MTEFDNDKLAEIEDEEGAEIQSEMEQMRSFLNGIMTN